MNPEKPNIGRRGFLKGFAVGVGGVMLGREVIKDLQNEPTITNTLMPGDDENVPDRAYTAEGFLDRGPSNKQETYRAFLQRLFSESGFVPQSIKQYDFEIDDDGIINLEIRNERNIVTERIPLLSAEQTEQYPTVSYQWFTVRMQSYFGHNPENSSAPGEAKLEQT